MGYGAVAMHELSLMENVLEIVRSNALQSNITKVYKLKLVVGKLSMALPDSLQFAFQVLGQDEMFKQAVLEIEEKEVIGYCKECQKQFTIKNDYCFVCPTCGKSMIDLIEGRELYLEYYEGD
ncbi:MAG TPA: hydrogenase maturation nickel metallochaperone HypA [Syntrophomonas sp.]|jgi:hydrogenase nickel incorporation protein HypA/HybF|nr:hydrogenase maturation nickel metallochaperone HypA [Syntrophomonas sp.]HCF71826.1 hydrogenase maturation nickel metallochaperone HypA [Syntrophomonas sp.]